MPPNQENTSQDPETNDLILQKIGDIQAFLEMVLVKVGQRDQYRDEELNGMREQFGSLIDDLKKKYSSAEIVQMLLGSEELDALIDKKLPDRITNTDTVTVREEVPQEKLELLKREVLVEARRSLRERMDKVLPAVMSEEIRKAFSTYRVQVKDIDGLNELIQERLEKVYETIQKFSRNAGGGSLELHKLKDVDVTGLEHGMILKYDATNGGRFYFANEAGATSGIGEAFETFSKNLGSFPYALTYTGENVTAIEYTTGSGTITKTLNYTGDRLDTIVLSGATPAGIDLTKTLSYTGENLTSVSYS